MYLRWINENFCFRKKKQKLTIQRAFLFTPSRLDQALIDDARSERIDEIQEEMPVGQSRVFKRPHGARLARFLHRLVRPAHNLRIGDTFAVARERGEGLVNVQPRSREGWIDDKLSRRRRGSKRQRREK